MSDKRKFQYLFHRGIVVMTMVMLMFISGASALLLSRYSQAGFLVTWPVLGDFFLPLCFVLLAQIFRNRICAVIAVALAFASVILRILALVVRNETFMPLGLDTIALLWEHADHNGLRAVFGDFYYLWMTPVVMAVCGSIIYFCSRVWIATRNKRRIIPNSWITVFAVLFVISICSSSVYMLRQRRTSQEEIVESQLVRPVPLVVAKLAGDIVDRAFKDESVSGYFPENLPEESAELLSAWNVEKLKPQGAEIVKEKAEYDRIIVVAAESLDLDFIRAFNPEMPENITPELDKLFKNNLSFVNCFTAAQPTSWGLTALLMSRLDYRRELKTPGNPSLFTIGNAAGYAGYYFSPVSGSFGGNREKYLKIFGGTMEHFFFREELRKKFNSVSDEVWGMADFELFDAVFKQLKSPETPERFIAVISTIDIHPPYTVAGEFACKHGFLSDFLKSLHSFDHHLGKFIRRIQNDPELYNERTLIVLTADHSATHGENYLKRSNFNPARIPLIFISPNLKPLKDLNRKKYCSSLDITPTLVRLIGGRIPRSFMGRDLREAKNCAISRTPADVLQVNSPDLPGTMFVKLGEKEYDTPEKEAFNDYFNLYYSN